MGNRTFRARSATAEPGLNERIAEFYDSSSGLWEDIWGEHMHHGIYRPERPPKSNLQAQIDLMDESLEWAGVKEVQKMVDVGCGIGGSSRHIIRELGGTAKGISLSPVQAARANEITAEEGLSDRAEFLVADALDQPFEDGEFDLVWSLESGEHMPDKKKFVSELHRVCAPGGRVLIVTWCHRNLAPGEKLTAVEELLFDWINAAYALPSWVSIEEYQELFASHGMEDVKCDDWSELVAPFWGAVIRSSFTPRGMAGLLKAGSTAIKGALVMPLMSLGFNMGTIKFNLITGRKPL
ncbi:hypothetical protein BSKO_08067 [Bryopsis sp. KO-2023]|nr:hypothetical protein BSKO_08067 [Bryopsis sp. KO-2023]